MAKQTAGWSKRKQTTSGGIKRTTTTNTNKGTTMSSSIGGKGYRTTTTRGPDGRERQTFTQRTAMGVRRTTRTTSAPKRKKARQADTADVEVMLGFLWVAWWLLKQWWVWCIIGFLWLIS